MTLGRIVLAGGSGLLGSLLAKYFLEQRREVVVLTRAPRRHGAVRQVGWDGDTLGTWTRELEGAGAVINLAGQSVNCRYNRRNRRLILESRLEPTRILGEAIARCARPPEAWLNASTATIYRHSFDRVMDEATGEIAATPEARDAFSIEVARAWEEILETARTPVTRKVALRTAMVLTPGKNSVLPVLRRLTRFGLGGAMAGGRQFVSWIHEVDFCRAVGWILDHREFAGAVNLAAPGPVPNRELMALLRRLVGAPFGLPAPGWLLEIGAFLLGTEPELVVKSRRVVPGRLLASGFRFRFPAIEEALRDLLLPGAPPPPKGFRRRPVPLHGLILGGAQNLGGTMMHARLIKSVLGCLTVMAASAAPAQDWPQWRGPNRDARAAAFNAPKTWPKQLNRKWQVTVGQGDAPPALVGDRLYVFSRQDGNEVIRALDAATGKEAWQDKYETQGATGPASGHSGPRCSPAVADGKVVTLGVRGTLSCLEAASGKKLWRKDDFGGSWPRFFTSSSPLILDGLCIAQLGGEQNGALVAYDLATGEQKWKWSGDSPGYASPVAMTVAGTKLIIAETERRIVAVGAADGKLVWETPYRVEGGMGYNASSPLVDGQTIIFSGSNRGVKAVKLEKQGEGFAAKDLWSNQDNSVQFNTPVLKDGLLFGLNGRNQFFCLKAQDGKTAWTSSGGQPEEGKSEGKGEGKRGRRGGRGGGRGGYGSLVDAGSVLLALTPSSELVVLQPSEKDYTELAKIKVAETPTYAHPVVSGNRLFVKDQESLALLTIEN